MLVGFLHSLACATCEGGECLWKKELDVEKELGLEKPSALKGVGCRKIHAYLYMCMSMYIYIYIRMHMCVYMS